MEAFVEQGKQQWFGSNGIVFHLMLILCVCVYGGRGGVNPRESTIEIHLPLPLVLLDQLFWPDQIEDESFPRTFGPAPWSSQNSQVRRNVAFLKTTGRFVA